jgi:hypothetical protein
MANEAVLVFEVSKPIPMTCADGAGIEKGALLVLSDPMTVATSSADNQIFGGIAAEEKIASDGKTKIGVYQPYSGNIFKMTVDAGDVATIGVDAVLRAANAVGVYDTLDDEKGLRVGQFLETGVAADTVLVRL